jgi:hypothetical protein
LRLSKKAKTFLDKELRPAARGDEARKGRCRRTAYTFCAGSGPDLAKNPFRGRRGFYTMLRIMCYAVEFTPKMALFLCIILVEIQSDSHYNKYSYVMISIS